MHIASQLSEAIRKHGRSLTAAQKRIADYVLENTSEVAFLTVDRLAAQTGVSASSVTRFAVEMGFSGYPELQDLVQSAVRRQLSTTGRPEALNVYSASFECEVRAIEEVGQMNSSALLDQVVTMLMEAREICIMGMRSSYGLADYLAFQLNRALGTATLLSQDSGRMLEHLVGLNGADVLVAISFPPYARVTHQSATYARERGVRVLAITDGPRSPLAPLADLMLQVPFDRETLFHSQTTALALEHALVVGVAARRPEQVRGRVERISEEMARAGIFVL